ncbi:hypothetical protein BGZ80_000961 [Entomortierella chlamydospora]|uniref:Uncharacterized protein n=1 Tax=Entomortierella chlamydospora TaxID=101097 RepID=A0A9P6MRH1_9FUNG|nr:hypothetical protein BGZ80_000961 [Entomortierella chlamydospora]
MATFKPKSRPTPSIDHPILGYETIVSTEFPQAGNVLANPSQPQSELPTTDELNQQEDTGSRADSTGTQDDSTNGRLLNGGLSSRSMDMYSGPPLQRLIVCGVILGDGKIDLAISVLLLTGFAIGRQVGLRLTSGVRKLTAGLRKVNGYDGQWGG